MEKTSSQTSDTRLRELDRKCPRAEFFRVLRSLAPVTSADLRDALRDLHALTDEDVGLYLALFQWDARTISYDGTRWHVMVGRDMEGSPAESRAG